jgi:hypothetical protein
MIRRGDSVILTVGDWQDGRYVEDARIVSGKVVRTDPVEMTARVSYIGRKPGRPSVPMTTTKPFYELTPNERN